LNKNSIALNVFVYTCFTCAKGTETVWWKQLFISPYGSRLVAYFISHIPVLRNFRILFVTNQKGCFCWWN